MSESQASEKKPKSYYVDFSKRSNRYGHKRGGGHPVPTVNARYRDAPDIGFGQKGFLITSVDEVKSYLEMKNILLGYYHELYDQKEGPERKKDVSVEDEIESELKQLRFTKPFRQVKTHCRNTLFINISTDFHQVNPVLVVDKFFDDLNDRKEIMTRNTNRVLPILDTFRNNVSCAKESISSILSYSFEEDGEKSYFIELQARGNYKLGTEEKQKMVEGVAETITLLRPSWKVSRDNADYIVILVVLKNVCCSTIVKMYFQRSKYNVIEFCKDFPITLSNQSASLAETIQENTDAHSKSS